MTWSYSGDPGASTKDAVRYLIGDIDTTDQLISNEAIAYEVARQPVITLAAANCCDAIGNYFARKPTYSNGSLSHGAERAKQFYDAAETLRQQDNRNAVHGVSILVGGRVLSERETLANNTSLTQPSFEVGSDDIPFVPSNNNTTSRRY